MAEREVTRSVDSKDIPEKGSRKNSTAGISSLMSNTPSKDDKKMESIEDLKVQLETLMNSLATLSLEKSKMEANFQADRKQLRNEREQYEKKVKELRDRCKKLQNSSHSETEHLKYKLILERHEKEKEQAQHVAMMKELQRLVSEERHAKEQLEAQIRELKTQSVNRARDKILEAELEIVKNKLKQAESAAKGTSPLLLSLQAEMTALRRQHRNAIQEEQKRVAAAEEQARIIAMTHESRVASLETKLSEISKSVGGYERLRQKDQVAIQKLKEQLVHLQDFEEKNESNLEVNDPKEIVTKIEKMCSVLMNVDKELYRSVVEGLLPEESKNSEYKSKYESLLQEFEDCKNQAFSINKEKHSARDNKTRDETTGENGQLHRLKTHCRNLEEKTRVLHAELGNRDKEYKKKLETVQQSVQEERMKLERSLIQKDNEFRGKIASLEQQILRQRERSLAVINEKDQEIHTLKSSFHALLPKKGEKSAQPDTEVTKEFSTDLITGLLTVDNNSPMLHYTQELARKEVEISNLRKTNLELEGVIRDREREFMSKVDQFVQVEKNLKSQIERFDACQSREGANLEYLKNVFVNYLANKDPASKKHMLNAISTILKFTAEETKKFGNFK